MEQMEKVLNYIKESMPKCVYSEKDAKTAGQLPLIKPYSAPCVKEAHSFSDIYYWDTYFINLALLNIGDIEQAINNADNLEYLLNTFGYIPNGSNKELLCRSQPPFFSLIVRDIYEVTKDTVWLKNKYKALIKEYNFWKNERAAYQGLNRYFYIKDESEFEVYFYNGLSPRTKVNIDVPISIKKKIGISQLAEAESGWDFTPRFESRCDEFLPVDLNCLLYALENNMAYFKKECAITDEFEWDNIKEKRKATILNLMFDEKTGFFVDYNFVYGYKSKCLTLAGFMPLFVGIATNEQAEKVKENLVQFEYAHGLSQVIKDYPRMMSYQWDYPNCWLNYQYLTAIAFRNYGFKSDAERIMKKNLEMIASVFKSTGHLWEKYNVLEGNINVKDEYKMPQMLGWTAGVFTAFYKLVNDN